MFRTKYHKKYQKEVHREIEIQKLMNQGNDRVRAVHLYDYNQEAKTHLIGSKSFYLINSRNSFSCYLWIWSCKICNLLQL